MLKDKKVLFISEYSKENILLAEEICENSKSTSIFWENSDLKLSKGNYFDMIDTSDDMSEKFFIISESKESRNFIDSISDVLLKSNAEMVITRGETYDIWPISLIKEYFSINHIPFITILDKIIKFEDFDKKSLKPFDYIYGLGPSCLTDDFKEKTGLFSLNREYSIYKDIQSPVVGSVLFLCNKKNINNLSNHPRLDSKKISFVDAEYCPDQELCILLNLAEIIVDESDFYEMNFILKKMGKKSFNIKEFFEKNHNILVKESRDFIMILERKKIFFKKLKKDFEKKLEKFNYSLEIEGSTISLGD